MANNDLILEVARRSGVSVADVRSVVEALRDPMSGITHKGDIGAAIPPFEWPQSFAAEFSDIFVGWSGLTLGEYDNTCAAVTWRAMCDRLLDQEPVYAWELAVWPHPITPKEPME